MRSSAGYKSKQTIPNEIREAFKGAVDLILPFKCPVCGDVSDTEGRFGNYEKIYSLIYGKKSDLHICGKCLSRLSINDEDKRWFLCLSDPLENDPHPELPLFMPFTYKGLVEKAVPKIKFSKKVELARLFGIILGSCFRDEGIRADLIVPIPLSEARLEERGYNQAGEIAYPISKINNIPFAEDCLVRIRDTKRQAEIRDKGKRANNIKGAFEVSDKWDVTGLTVAVVDDVATSGSTLHEAALVLYKAGAAKVLCVAFAGNRMLKNSEPF